MEAKYGKNIRELRKARRLTQTEFAEKAGIALSSLRRYETDERQPTMQVIGQMAEALGVGVVDLVGAPEDRRPTPTPFTVGLDWLEALGWKVAVHEEEGYRDVLLKNMETYESYKISDELLHQLTDSLASFSRYQIQEMIKKCKKFGG